MIKIAHISDVHIKNNKEHDVYREVFEKLYKSLREEEVDYIIFTGDLAHTKTNLSPEYFTLAREFLENLRNIATTYLILGNHDGNLSNSIREDAVTPVIESFEHHYHINGLCLLKDSKSIGVHYGRAAGGRFKLHCLSIFDRDWSKIEVDEKDINIGLFHGPVQSSVTDSGFKLSGEPLETFKQFDYTMLGDIHTFNQSLNEKGTVRYAGSLIQQNFGETPEKGYLIWEIESKTEFNVRPITLERPKPFITIRSEKDLPTLPEGAQVRILPDKAGSLELETLREKVKRSSPSSLITVSTPKVENVEINVDGDFETSLRDYANQKGYDDDITTDALELYKKLDVPPDDITRGSRWNLNSMKWSNLFRYGEDNSIDFSSLSGLVGVFGRNRTGKSSIVDSILYGLYGTSSKKNRATSRIINIDKDECECEIDAIVNQRPHKIKRKSLRKKGDKSTTKVSFKIDNKSANGTSKSETDKKIQSVFGKLEDFLLTTFASQHEFLAYIDEGSTKRKEILGKFLGLDRYEAIHSAAKSEYKKRKTVLDTYSGSYEEKIEFAKESVRKAEAEYKQKEKERDEKLERLTEIKQEIKLREGEEKEDPEEIWMILTKRCTDLDALYLKLEGLRGELDTKSKRADKMAEFLSTLNIDAFKEELGKAERLRDEIIELTSFIDRKQGEIDRLTKSLEKYCSRPCGDEYPECAFLEGFEEKVREKEKLEIELSALKLSLAEKESGFDSGVIAKNKQRIENHYELRLKEREEKSNIEKLQWDLERSEKDQDELESAIADLQVRYEAASGYNEDSELKALKEEKKRLEPELGALSLVHYMNMVGVCISELEHQEREQKFYIEKLKETEAAKLLADATSSNGIPFEIIKTNLSFVNQEIDKILDNNSYGVRFEADDKNLEIFVDDGGRSIPIEMGSGAEKMMASMAIRLAMSKISTLPQGDIFILDEPATSFDPEQMAVFQKILEMLKSHFRVVILISHLSNLQDLADIVIEIEDDGEFSKVSV